MTYIFFNEEEIKRLAKEKEENRKLCPECLKKHEKHKTIRGFIVDGVSSISVQYCPKCGYISAPWWMQQEYYQNRILNR